MQYSSNPFLQQLRSFCFVFQLSDTLRPQFKTKTGESRDVYTIKGILEFYHSFEFTLNNCHKLPGATRRALLFRIQSFVGQIKKKKMAILRKTNMTYFKTTFFFLARVFADVTCRMLLIRQLIFTFGRRFFLSMVKLRGILTYNVLSNSSGLTERFR